MTNSENYLDTITELKTQVELLGNRCNQLLADKGALTDEVTELRSELAKRADTNHSLVEQMADLESKNAELKDQLTKAIELLKWALHSDPEHDNLDDFDTKWKEAEQFIKEIEK